MTITGGNDVSLADTGNAIGKITQLIRDHINAKTGLTVTVGRPEPAPGVGAGARLNIFLYEALFDPALRNHSLDTGQSPPLWLILKYLLTSFDDNGNSDTIQAHEYCGQGIRALQEMSYLPLSNHLPPDPEIFSALKDNPEGLKITFDETTSELLTKLMQGGDEKYRFSMSFQVRPVMIASPEPPSYSLLVGVDYTKEPHKIIGEEGVRIPVIPTMGPEINSVEPVRCQVGDSLTISGNQLDFSGLSVGIGPVELPLTAQRSDKVVVWLDPDRIHGGAISAGSHPVTAILTLPTGRKRSSNLEVVGLIPALGSITLDSMTRLDPADPSSNVYGNIDIRGTLLGTIKDDVFIALFRNGKIVKLFDEFKPIPLPEGAPPAQPQTEMRIGMTMGNAVPPGTYRIILRVNGMQALNSPEVELTVP